MKILDARETKPLEGGASFPLSHRMFRALWQLVWLFFASWTPPPLHFWRVFLLRMFGAEVHPTARVYSSVNVWYPPNLVMREYAVLGPRVICYCMEKITLGARATVSQGAHLCGGTHDIDDPSYQLFAYPIVIGTGAWIAAEAFVGPGVEIGDYAVLGARSVLFKNIDAYDVFIGNPAFFVRKRVFRD